MAKLLIDIGPLRRFPQYRRLWTGYAISQIGSQFSVAAVAYQVYVLTRSSFDVGAVSLAQLVPGLLAPMVGGAIADAFDRRRVLVGAALCMSACSLGLAINAEGGRPWLWPLFVLPSFTALFNGVASPTSTAMQMTLVDRESMVAANVLRQTIQRLGSVIGPTVAGLLIAAGGVRLAYWIDVASFAVVVAAVSTLAPLRSPEGGATRFGRRSIVEGFSFLRGRRAIQACLIADLNATVLGLPTSLFPAIALTRFGHLSVVDHAQIYGLLAAAPGAGALAGSFLSGWTGTVRRQGLAVLLSITLWGGALAGFGSVADLPACLVLLAIAGWADLVSAAFRNSIIQLETPDRLRGRLSAITVSLVTSGPRLGNFEAGAVAAVSSTEISILSGGIGCIVAMALLAKLMPSFVRYGMAP